MAPGRWLLLLLALSCLVGVLDASAGDADPLYRTCVEECEQTGSLGEISISHCQFPETDTPVNSSWYVQEPLYLQWKQLNCRSDCRYHCMMQREKERAALGLSPVKYHGKWPFKRIFVFQEPVSSILSAVNLMVHFTGWLSFFLLVNYKLPLRPQTKRTYYEYTGLWHIYGLLSMNAWFWSAIFHSRDFDLTEKLDYSSLHRTIRRGMLETLKYLLGSAGPSGFGSKSTAEEVTHATPDLRHITAIITGATSGIGAETARVLAMRGARLILPARSLKTAEETKARIEAEFPGSVITVFLLDLCSLSSVRSFVCRFLALQLPLNLLINNAGRFSHGYAVTEDGVEETFATNYLGHFLLTKLLLENMIETASMSGIEGRIVNVSSGIHGWFSSDPLGYLDLLTRNKIPYDPTQAYAVSKLANVLHTKELSERLKKMGSNVTVNCVHPGIVRTRLTRDREGILTDLVFFLSSKFLKTIPQAAATTCYVATHPTVAGVSGKYFSDCNESSPSSAGCSTHQACRLWRASEAMTVGLKYEM